MYVDKSPPLQPSRCCCRRNDMQHDQLCIFVLLRIGSPYAGLFCIPLHGSHAEHASPDWQYMRSSVCSQEPCCCQDTISIKLSHRMLTAGSNTNMLLHKDSWEEEEEEDDGEFLVHVTRNESFHYLCEERLKSQLFLFFKWQVMKLILENNH